MSGQDRDFKGVWIPREIWLNKDLSMLEKVIYVEIDSLDNEFHCIASNKYFAEFCGCSESAVSKAISKLIDLGLIKTVSFDGRTRVLASQDLQGSLVNFTRQNDKIYEADSENLRPNNIYNNKVNNIIYNKTQAELASQEGETKEESDFNSHAYQEETPKERYKRLKAERQKSDRKKSDYELHSYQEEKLTVKDACRDYIDKFTDDESLRAVLVDYLDVRVVIKDKPFSLRTWQGTLAKLKNLDGDKIDIVKQSIKENWASFYPINNNKGKKPANESWDKNVRSEAMTEEDYKRQQAFLEEKRKNGERTVF